MAEAETSSPVSIGTALHYARVAGGWTHDDICHQLKLPLATVLALEQDRFSVVGAPVYVRGFVRSYARLVGLSETDLDAQLTAHFAAIEPDLKPSHGARRSISWGERYSWAFSYLVGTALVLTLIWTVIGFESDTQRMASEIAPPPASTTQPVANVDAMFATGLEAAGPQPQPQMPMVRPLDPPPVMASMSPFSTGEAPVVVATDAMFRLALDAPSWVEISDSTGKRVAFGTLEAGSHGFSGTAPFQLLIGNAQAARIEAAGRALDINPFMRANVARFKLEEHGNGLEPVTAVR